MSHRELALRSRQRRACLARKSVRTVDTAIANLVQFSRLTGSVEYEQTAVILVEGLRGYDHGSPFEPSHAGRAFQVEMEAGEMPLAAFT